MANRKRGNAVVLRDAEWLAAWRHWVAGPDKDVDVYCGDGMTLINECRCSKCRPLRRLLAEASEASAAQPPPEEK